MNPAEIFINPQTGLFRSGWRVLIFLALFLLPQILFALLETFAAKNREEAPAGISLSIGMIFTYVVLDVWLLTISWFCLKLLDRRHFAALGFSFDRGWWRETWLGCAIAALMIGGVVLIQMTGDGTRITFNARFWKTVDGVTMMDWQGWGLVLCRVSGALILFIFAGLYEELLFRGYAFQTLLRGLPAYLPIVLLSGLFGLIHLGNPSATFFSTANTILAGVWLSVAYLKTRRLWFPTALHFVWNWMMGAVFGLPVSGLKFISSPVLFSTSEAPLWLTGGSYGPEGGASVTLVLLIVTAILWQAKWLRAWEPASVPADDSLLALGLHNHESR